MEKSENVVWQISKVTRADRAASNRHRSVALWLTGLSGAGKSTLAIAVEARLHEFGLQTFLLDGDNLRHGLCSDLGFTDADRTENIRRVGQVSRLFVEAGIVALSAFISPFEVDRALVRAMFDPGDFYEVYCKCSLAECELRDVKGLYRRARAGELKNFTGISSRFEQPSHPELVIDTEQYSVSACVGMILDRLFADGLVKEPRLTPRMTGRNMG